jgi:integrase
MTTQNGRRPLSAAEVDTALSYVRTRADLARQRGTTRAIVDELIVLLLVKAGLRPNELCGLKIGDLFGTNGEMALGIRDTNGGIARKVDIREDAAERLVRFIKCHRNGAQAGDSLLESERGGPLGYMSLYSKVRRIGREAEIGRLSPFALRRTYIHELYEAEHDLRYVQQQAGYASRRSIAKHVKVNVDGDDTMGDCAGTRERTSAGPRAADSVQAPTCEACGTILANGRGERIESGQLLCDGCLMYFRRA